MKRNYLDDIDFFLRLWHPTTECECVDAEVIDPCDTENQLEEIGWPDFDWEAKFWTKNRVTPFVASCIGGKCKNCFNDNGKIHVVMNNHGMRPGVLMMELRTELPNGIYPDGARRIMKPQKTCIILTRECGDCPTKAEIEATLPYIKGEPFRWEDFTPEQIAELQRPATEAAGRVEEAEEQRANLEAARQRSEQTRYQNELRRMAAEDDRKLQEGERLKAENLRAITISNIETDESLRKEAEEAREVAEKKRVEEFAGMADEIAASKLAYFIDRYNTLFGSHGKYDPVNAPDEKHPFYGNTLWMTYEEALRVVELTAGAKTTNALSSAFSSSVIRTNVPFMTKTKAEIGVVLQSAFRGSSVEVINLEPIDAPSQVVAITGTTDWIFQSPNLKRVIGDIRFKDKPPYYNGTSAALQDIHIKALAFNLDIRQCKNISLESLQYMVANAANTSAITITVHADAYAKLTDESNAEWYAVLTSAADRNISFATV